MRLRFSDDELEALVQNVERTACVPSAWSQKVKEALASQSGPSPKVLRQFLNEADKFSVPVEEVAWLQNYLDQVNAWIEEAAKYIIRKHQHRRRDGKGTKTYTGERYQRISELLEKESHISFDAPEVQMLKDSFNMLNDLKNQAIAVLTRPESTIADYKEVYDFGVSIGADVPEMQQLEMKIRQHEWQERAPRALQNEATTYQEIVNLLQEADVCQIPRDDVCYSQLLEREHRGKEWIALAERILHHKNTNAQEEVTLEHIRQVLEAGIDVPRVPHLYSALHDLATRAADTLRDAEDILRRGQSMPSTLTERPSAVDAQRVLKSIESLPIQVPGKDILAHEIARTDAWVAQAKKIFNVVRSNGHKSFDTILNDIMTNVKTITEAAMSSGEGQQQSSSGSSKPDVYCLCRTPESGLMIECDQCHEWYHGPCVRVTKREAKAQMSYICPICDVSQNIHHATKRARLEDIAALVREAETLMFMPKVYPIISQFATRMQKFREHVQAFCRSKTQLGLEDLPMIKQHLRELEGLEILLQDETEFLRRKVQTLSPPPSSSSAAAHEDSIMEEPVYCLCRRATNPNDPHMQMIGCDYCHEWFHIGCVNLTAEAVKNIEQYMCPSCKASSSSSKPQPIIKLTVKPPSNTPRRQSRSQSSSEHRKRKHDPEHHGRSRKQHKRDDILPSSSQQ